jgi:hypothetical protein
VAILMLADWEFRQVVLNRARESVTSGSPVGDRVASYLAVALSPKTYAQVVVQISHETRARPSSGPSGDCRVRRAPNCPRPNGEYACNRNGHSNRDTHPRGNGLTHGGADPHGPTTIRQLRSPQRGNPSRTRLGQSDDANRIRGKSGGHGTLLEEYVPRTIQANAHADSPPRR